MGVYRYELKFQIDSKTAHILKQRLALIMEIDKNSNNLDNTYLIRSLYFDDENSTAYYEKMDGVEFRKKYRIRIYNYDDSFIRLECKYKHNNMTMKKQVRIARKDCENIINGNLLNYKIPESGLLKEFLVDYRLNHLKPSVIVDYIRTAYTYHVSDVRITFDEKIKSGLYNYDLFDKDYPLYSIIDDDVLIMEVKFNEVLPENIALILSSVPTLRQAFSKFAFCRSIK